MQKGEYLKLAIQSQLQVGLKWNFTPGDKIDIDASVLMLNELGQAVDAVFKDNTSS